MLGFLRVPHIFNYLRMPQIYWKYTFKAYLTYTSSILEAHFKYTSSILQVYFNLMD